jgi:hypothetical protein
MSNTPTVTAKSPATPTPEQSKKRVENHKTTATHLEESAKHHIEAAKHVEAGNHEKAANSALAAHGHQIIANELHKEELKNHAVKH